MKSLPVKNILGQIIQFVVPLIVIGFIAPSITKLGNNATKMLGVALVLAYVSSVLAAFLSMASGYVIIPNMPVADQAAALRELPADVFGLAIPQIMGVMSALWHFPSLSALLLYGQKQKFSQLSLTNSRKWFSISFPKLLFHFSLFISALHSPRLHTTVQSQNSFQSL